MDFQTSTFIICLVCLLGSATANVMSPGLGKCMDIQADLKKDGTRETVEDMKKKTVPINVQLYKCHGKHNQQWMLDAGQIKSVSLGLCLQATAVADNKNVEIAKCSGGANQKWLVDGLDYIKAAGSEKCVDVKALKKKDGTYEKFDEIKTHTTVNVHLYKCHDPTTTRVNQLWNVVAFRGDDMVTEQKWGLFAARFLNSDASSNAAPIFAMVGAAAFLMAGIFIGLRVRPAPVQPMSELE